MYSLFLYQCTRLMSSKIVFLLFWQNTTLTEVREVNVVTHTDNATNEDVFNMDDVLRTEYEINSNNVIFPSYTTTVTNAERGASPVKGPTAAEEKKLPYSTGTDTQLLVSPVMVPAALGNVFVTFFLWYCVSFL